MILMVSGRCDIPAFYSNWFMNRYRDGYVMTRNPFNRKLVSKISFSNVDLIMFCSKNPTPMVKYLKEINKPIVFHITLTPYKNDVEVNVGDKKQVIESIKEISSIIGVNNTIVRYDPIFISNKYSLDYHIKVFNKLCTELDGYVNKIIVSFLDVYKNVIKNMACLKYYSLSEEIYKSIGTNFSSIAKEHNMSVQTCFEKRNLEEYGFIVGDCMSKEYAYLLTGKKFRKQNIRKGKLCHCVETVDIGEYNSCNHMCKYCYANFDEDRVRENTLNHFDDSPLLIGRVEEGDIIKERS